MSKYHKNGIISLDLLKIQNYYLFRVLVKNLDKLSSTLMDEFGIRVLDSGRKLDLNAYLRYHFGDTVNLTELRKNHRRVYNSITELGLPAQVITDWGFSVSYDTFTTDEQIVNFLKSKADSNGVIKDLGKKWYDRLFYRARKSGLTVQDYLARIGFTLPEVDDDYIVYLHDNQGKSFREIADIVGLSKSTVHSRYRTRSDNNDFSRKSNNRGQGLD